MSQTVRLRCVSEGSRLRVKIISPGYYASANCQFPRDLRSENSEYEVPVSAVTLAQGPAGKYFYRVRARDVRRLESNMLLAVYGAASDDCCVCMDNPCTMVIAPCGHYCLCTGCVTAVRGSVRSCPMCRGPIGAIVSRDQIQ